VQREIAARFRGDPEGMRRAAQANAVRTVGVETSNDLALVLSLIPELREWTTEEKTAAAKILRAKESGAEAHYLRLMQRHARMRAAFLKIGS
jgi:hypothetical protein